MISDERLAEMLSGLDGLTPADCADNAEIDTMARELFRLRTSHKELMKAMARMLELFGPMGLKENRELDGHRWEEIISLRCLLELVPLFRRAIIELAYIQEAPAKELCQTSEGREIIAEAKKLLERVP